MNCTDNKVKETVRISTAMFYGKSFSGAEYVEVSREVYNYLVTQKRKEKRAEMRHYRHIAAFGYNDEKMAGMCGKFQQSLEDEYIEELDYKKFCAAFKALFEKHRKRLYLYFYCGLTYERIGERENTSEAAIRSSLKTALKKFHELYGDIE